VPRRRRHRLPIVKLAEFQKAKWFIGRGMPVGYIAERLGVSPVTVRAWRRLMNHDHTFKELRRRVLQLPACQREQIATEIANAAARRWS